MRKVIKPTLNSLSKIALGAAGALCFAGPIQPWLPLLIVFCAILESYTRRPDQIEREVILEQQVDELEQKAILDRLTIDNLQQNLATATKANQAMEQQFQAWATQAQLQGAILTGATKRLP